jgi:hypothetical protein
MGVLRKSLPLLFLLLLGLLLAAYLSLPGIVGRVVVKVFQEGTDCKVDLYNPKIRFRSLTASIESVSIVCPGEEEGFTAEKVVIGSSWSELFNKTVLLSPLRIEGVRAVSRSMDSSLFKTILFILTKPEKEPKEPSRMMQALSPLTGGWHIWVPEVSVEGIKGDETESLVFGFDDTALHAYDVTFVSRDEIDHSDGVVVLEAESSQVILKGANMNDRPLGALEFVAHISDGVLSLRTASLVNQKISEVDTFEVESDLFRISASGGVVIKEDRLDIQVELDAKGEDLKKTILPELPEIGEGTVHLEASIKGPYDQLVVESKLSIEDLKFDQTSETYRYMPASFSFMSKYDVSEKTLELTQVEVDQYLSGSTSKVSFKKLPDISVELEGNIGRKDIGRYGKLDLGLQIQSEKKIISLDKFSIDSVSLTTVLANLEPFIGTAGAALLSPEVLEKKYQVTLGGTAEVLYSPVSVVRSDFKALVSAGAEDDYFQVTVKGENNKNRILAVVSGIQETPVFDLLIDDQALKGTYGFSSFELRRVPVIARILQQGDHIARLDGVLEGTIDAPQLEAEVSIQTSVRRRRREGEEQGMREERRGRRELPPRASRIELKYNASGMMLAGNIFDQGANFSCNPVNETTHDCSLVLDSFPFRYFFPRDSGKIEETTVSGSSHYQGPLNDIFSGEGSLSIEEIVLPQELSLPPLVSAIEARLGNRQFILTPIIITGAEIPLVVQAQIGDRTGWDVTAKGEFLLGNMIHQMQFLESISGVLEVDFALKGPIDSPALDGVLVVRDSDFTFPLGEGIVGGDSISGTILLADQMLVVPSIEGLFGDGKFTIRGEIGEIFSSETRKGTITFEASDVRLEPTSGLGFLANINTDFVLTPGEKPLLQGSLLLDDAVYESALRIETVISTLTSLVLGGFTVRSKTDDVVLDSGLLVDLEISAPAGLYLDTTVLQAEFLGGVQLKGDLFAPTVSGEILVLDGEFSISQTDFRIISGRAVFDSSRGSLNPTLSLSSEGELRSLSGETQRIYLTLGGTLRTPRVSLSSDGYATQRELAQQLGMAGGGGSQVRLVDEKTSRKVGFREVISPTSELSLTERFVGLTGFDDVRLETVVAARTGEFVPQVVGGRPLPFDLRGVLLTELAGDRANAARLEYQLNEVLTTYLGWRSQSVINPGTTSAANFLFGVRFDETFKGFSFFENRLKEER